MSDFIFSEKTRFILDGSNYHLSLAHPESRFIKFKFEKGAQKQPKKQIFQCMYKMMRKFQYSLN
ncbi:MAG: hypothetical protein ABGW91_10885 [Christiangramia sp.]